MTADLLTANDTLLLDQMVAHEAKCQALHGNDWRIPPCSVAVAYVSTTACKARRVLVCSAAAEYVFQATAIGADCRCGAPCSSCWKVTPA